MESTVKKILLPHLLSALFVSVLILTLAFILRPVAPFSRPVSDELKTLQQLNLNPQDAFQSQLYHEMARTLTGPDSVRYFELWRQLVSEAGSERLLEQKQYQQRLAYRKSFSSLLWMYVKFVFVFLIVMAATYYGVQTLGLYFFVRRQQMRPPDFYRLFFLLRQWLIRSDGKLLTDALRVLIRIGARAMFFLLFFAPAYVVAYSLKSDFTSQSILFLIVLGVLTNGLLITYATKFYHFLLNESQKGYVRTAIVKNLSNDYQFKGKNGIAPHQIFALKKQFKGHVLQHIYMNSAFQYVATFKEQAAFVISSLVIIEMALNIHGHLSYELLQQLLYRNFDQALYMVLGLYLLVKATEIFTDFLVLKKRQRLEKG